METLTIQIDCNEKTCGNCVFWRNEFDDGSGQDACMIFNKILEYEYCERVRCPECIAACQKEKDKAKKTLSD
jgi:hypothetical protein